MNKILTRFKCMYRPLLVMAVCLSGGLAAHAASITVDGINYTTSGTKATVAKYTIVKATADTPADTTFYKGDIVIPETITHDGVVYTVVATAANSFLDCRELTSVTLPATCVTIARNTFKGCTALRVSPLPPTVTSVGKTRSGMESSYFSSMRQIRSKSSKEFRPKSAVSTSSFFADVMRPSV